MNQVIRSIPLLGPAEQDDVGKNLLETVQQPDRQTGVWFLMCAVCSEASFSRS